MQSTTADLSLPAAIAPEAPTPETPSPEKTAPAIQDPVDPTIPIKIGSQLLNTEVFKFVVGPGMLGGLGHVALRVIQDETSFVSTPTQDTRTEQLPIQPKHDFVPSIQAPTGIELSILMLSSIFLGAVVGFIGTLSTIGGPVKDQKNKSKLASSALLFALFFPSAINAFHRSAVSEAAVTNLQAEVQVVEQTRQETVQDVEAAVDLLEAKETIQTIQAVEDTAAAKVVEDIFEIGEGTNNDDIRQQTIETLESIKANPDIAPEVQETAEQKAETLAAIEAANATPNPVQ